MVAGEFCCHARRRWVGDDGSVMAVEWRELLLPRSRRAAKAKGVILRGTIAGAGRFADTLQAGGKGCDKKGVSHRRGADDLRNVARKSIRTCVPLCASP